MSYVLKQSVIKYREDNTNLRGIQSKKLQNMNKETRNQVKQRNKPKCKQNEFLRLMAEKLLLKYKTYEYIPDLWRKKNSKNSSTNKK